MELEFCNTIFFKKNEHKYAFIYDWLEITLSKLILCCGYNDIFEASFLIKSHQWTLVQVLELLSVNWYFVMTLTNYRGNG